MDTIQPKKFSLILRICLSIVLVGALFKIMHWPYASQLISIAIVGILIFYPIRFFLKKQKDSMDYVKLAMVVLWCLIYGIRIVLFSYPPIAFNIILALLFGWWFINEGTAYITDRKFTINTTLQYVYQVILFLSIGSIILGALFKIQHWPYSNMLMIIGVLSTSLIIIIDYFVRE